MSAKSLFMNIFWNSVAIFVFNNLFINISLHKSVLLSQKKFLLRQENYFDQFKHSKF